MYVLENKQVISIFRTLVNCYSILPILIVGHVLKLQGIDLNC